MIDGTKILKTIGLFGPNASGKSNILKAINASKKNHELEATSGGLIMAKQRTASPSRRMKAAWRQVNKEKQKPSYSSHTDCELYIKHRIKMQINGITIMDSPACIVYNLIKWSQMSVIAIENAMKNTLQLAQIKDIKRQSLSCWCEVAEVGDWEE